MTTKIKHLLLLSFVFVLSSFYYSQTLIINELSQGPSGAKEFVEFLVVPTGVVNPCQQNASCLDLRGWIFDDNNTYFTPGNTSGVGLAQGALRFSNSAFWSCIPVGTLIVIYNDADINASLPGNDLSMADGNCKLVIPASSGLIEVNINNPSAAAPLVYPLAGWTPGGIWTTTGMANGGDSYQVYAPINTNIPAFSISWGNNSSNTIVYFLGPATGMVYYFNSNTNNPFLQANWSSASSAGGDTPGAGNNANNIAYINSLTNNCTPFQPLLANPSAVNSLCACNGSVNAAPTGGAGYTYQWTNALGQNIGATASVSNLCAGWYYVQVGSGGCTVNDSVQIINNGIPVNPTFTAMGPYCMNAVPGILPNVSNNGINGTWNPPVINTSVVGNATYTFTPAAGQCASNATLTVNTTNSVNPTFTAMGPYCMNAVPGVLPNTSNNGINGTWNPPVINTSVVGNANYTFTPAAGQCASNATLTVNTTNSVNPTFTAMGPYCMNGVPGVLPNASNNGINGTWNPPVINTSVVGNANYTFTPAAGQCASNATLTVNTTNSINPTFTAMGPYCLNGVPGILPNASNNGINGTWNPPVINTSVVGNANYTFTPAAGQCASNATLTVNTTNSVNPTFTAMGPYCMNGVPGVLPNASNNGINGTWNPPVINTSVVGNANYTFTPAAGQCASNATLTVNTTNSVNPTFTAMGPYCMNGVPGVLPNASNNGINGTWNPPVINTSVVGNANYTFTPTAGQCASNATLTVNTTNSINPTFTAMGPYCLNGVPGVLPNASNNGINGTWNPPVINTGVVGNANYTFTPAAGQCASNATLTVVIDNQLLPVFTPQGPFCLNTIAPNLPNMSTNGISGTWTPPSINTSSTGTSIYTFIPNVGQCGDTNILQIQIVDSIQPNFNAFGPYCLNEAAPNLPVSSLNGINGTWNPPSINTAALGTSTYVFTPTNSGCATNGSVDILISTLTVFAGNDTTLCSGQTLQLNGSGANTYIWNNGVTNGVTFTPAAGGNYIVCGTIGSCSDCDTLLVNLLPTPNVNFGSTVNGSDVQFQYTGSNAQGYQWSFGDGNASNLANPLNTYALPGVYNVTVTANNGPCIGSATNQITIYGPESVVEPINVITPNGDQVNDVFDLNLVGYKNLQGVILNRWGNVMAILTLNSMTWDGTSNGKLADEGVYFYQFEVTRFTGKKTFHQGFLHLYR